MVVFVFGIAFIRSFYLLDVLLVVVFYFRSSSQCIGEGAQQSFFVFKGCGSSQRRFAFGEVTYLVIVPFPFASSWVSGFSKQVFVIRVVVLHLGKAPIGFYDLYHIAPFIVEVAGGITQWIGFHFQLAKAVIMGVPFAFLWVYIFYDTSVVMIEGFGIAQAISYQCAMRVGVIKGIVQEVFTTSYFYAFSPCAFAIVSKCPYHTIAPYLFYH